MKSIKENYKNPMFSDGYISVADILLVLAKNLKLILLLPILLVVVALIYAFFFSEPLYKSTSKIMSSSTGSSFSQATGLAAQFGISLPTENSEPKWAYPEIIKSRALAKSVLEKEFFTNKIGSNQKLLAILTDDLAKSFSNMEKRKSIGAKRLLNMVDISEDMKTSIITLSVSAFEPKFSKDINNAIINELDLHQRSYNKTRTSEARFFIEERIISVEKELVLAEESLKNFRDRNRRIQNSPALQLEQQRLLREVTVLQEVFTTLKQQLEMTKIEEVKDSDYVIIIDPPSVPLEKSNPSIKFTLIMTMLFGLALSILVAFIKQFYGEQTKEERAKLEEAKLLSKENIYKILNLK